MTKELTFEEKKEKMIGNIRENYRQVEKSIVSQLYMKHDLHGTTIGSERELIWAQLFEMIIPKKFVIEQSVFIIDSGGRVSKEVDFAILDETYTPYIFRYGRVKFVPIEAIAAVIECKSQELKPKMIEGWAKSIKNLKTSGQSIARMANLITVEAAITQKSTRPIRILCALKDQCSPDIKEHFDFTLLASRQDGINERIEIECKLDESYGTLFDWYKSLNFHKAEDETKVEELSNAEELKKISLGDYEVKDDNEQPISLLTFNFQLNQLLMLINNPILFPHRAYVKLFNNE